MSDDQVAAKMRELEIDIASIYTVTQAPSVSVSLPPPRTRSVTYLGYPARWAQHSSTILSPITP